MTPRRFKCSQFCKDTLDFNFECIKILKNDFCKQRYIICNATISGQDRIYPKTHLCRTFFAEYMLSRLIFLSKKFSLSFCSVYIYMLFIVPTHTHGASPSEARRSSSHTDGQTIHLGTLVKYLTSPVILYFCANVPRQCLLSFHTFFEISTSEYLNTW